MVDPNNKLDNIMRDNPKYCPTRITRQEIRPLENRAISRSKLSRFVELNATVARAASESACAMLQSVGQGGRDQRQLSSGYPGCRTNAKPWPLEHKSIETVHDHGY